MTLALIPWLRWCLPGFSAVKLPFPLSPSILYSAHTQEGEGSGIKQQKQEFQHMLFGIIMEGRLVPSSKGNIFSYYA